MTRPNSGEQVEFDCPRCNPSLHHRLTAVFSNPLDGKPAAPWLGKPVKGVDGKEVISPVWTREGDDFKTLTISPSLQYPCWHGWVEDGMVINVTEATHHARDDQGQIVTLSPRQVMQLRAAGRIP